MLVNCSCMLLRVILLKNKNKTKKSICKHQNIKTGKRIQLVHLLFQCQNRTTFTLLCEDQLLCLHSNLCWKSIKEICSKTASIKVSASSSFSPFGEILLFYFKHISLSSQLKTQSSHIRKY